MENTTREEESVEAQVDVVQLAGKHLRKRWGKENQLFDPNTKKFATVANLRTDAAPDAAERISAFLGDKNWSRRKVTVGYTFSLRSFLCFRRHFVFVFASLWVSAQICVYKSFAVTCLQAADNWYYVV